MRCMACRIACQSEASRTEDNSRAERFQALHLLGCRSLSCRETAQSPRCMDSVMLLLFQMAFQQIGKRFADPTDCMSDTLPAVTAGSEMLRKCLRVVMREAFYRGMGAAAHLMRDLRHLPAAAHLGEFAEIVAFVPCFDEIRRILGYVVVLGTFSEEFAPSLRRYFPGDFLALIRRDEMLTDRAMLTLGAVVSVVGIVLIGFSVRS